MMLGSDATGLDRHVIFVDARDVKDTADLPAKGEANWLSINRFILSSRGLTAGPFKYRDDWDVGDIVTVQNKAWDLTMDTRITEVQEIHEASGFKLNVTFGNNLPPYPRS